MRFSVLLARNLGILALTCALLLGAAGGKAEDPPAESSPAVEAPASVTKRFLKLVLQDPAKAREMLEPFSRKQMDAAALAKEARLRWAAPEGFEAPVFTDAFAELTHGDWSMVMMQREMKATPAKRDAAKKAFSKEFDETFSPGERAAAAKLVRWEGDVLHDVVTVYLRRKDVGYPWEMFPTFPPQLPIPAFITDINQRWKFIPAKWRQVDTIYWDEAEREKAQRAERGERRRRNKELREQRRKEREQQAVEGKK